MNSLFLDVGHIFLDTFDSIDRMYSSYYCIHQQKILIIAINNQDLDNIHIYTLEV